MMRVTKIHRLVGLARFGFDLADLPDRKPMTSIGIPIALLSPRESAWGEFDRLHSECFSVTDQQLRSLIPNTVQHDPTD